MCCLVGVSWYLCFPLGAAASRGACPRAVLTCCWLFFMPFSVCVGFSASSAGVVGLSGPVLLRVLLRAAVVLR